MGICQQPQIVQSGRNTVLKAEPAPPSRSLWATDHLSKSYMILPMPRRAGAFADEIVL